MKQLDLNAINSVQTHQAQRPESVRPSHTNSPTTNTTHKKGDQVDVSAVGKEIGQLVERAKQLPDIRHERVNQLRELVQSGRYEVSSKEIAAAILRDEL